MQGARRQGAGRVQQGGAAGAGQAHPGPARRLRRGADHDCLSSVTFHAFATSVIGDEPCTGRPDCRLEGYLTTACVVANSYWSSYPLSILLRLRGP